MNRITANLAIALVTIGLGMPAHRTNKTQPCKPSGAAAATIAAAESKRLRRQEQLRKKK